MNTFVLDSQTASLPISDLVTQASNGGVQVHDAHGKVVVYILSPADKEAWTYAEAHLELDRHRSEIEEAVKRKSGITTKELLAKAANLARPAENR